MNNYQSSAHGVHHDHNAHTPVQLKKVASGQTAHVDLTTGGMTCAHCPPAIVKALNAIDAVTSAHVSLASRGASIDYDPSQVRVADLLQAILAHGYTAGSATTRIPLKNMHCTSCVIRTEVALQTTPGVVSARASLLTNSVNVEYQPDKTDFAALRGAIEQVGYKVAEPKAASGDEELAPEEEYRTLMLKAMILVKGGYTPDTIVVRAGKPVRLSFRREETASCSDKVVFADFGKSADLPTGATVPVEFIPKTPGEYAFACPMACSVGG